MAATDNALQELHAQIARSLTEAVKPIDVVDEETGTVKTLPPSAAHLAAAITFLKNNNITASPTSNKALSDLSDALAARRKKKIAPAALQEAEEQLAFNLGLQAGVQ
jgi:hypothetical protein